MDLDLGPKVLARSDDWTNDGNMSSLDYNFMTRHPSLSISFLIFTCLSVVLGNIGNVMVIGAVVSYRPLLRNKGSMFVINLAIADLCITGIISPMNMVGVTHGPRYFVNRALLCHTLGSICTVSCIVSMLSIAAVAVNRFVQICKYFVYHRIYTHKKTVLYCMSLWILAVLLDLPNWVGWGGHTFGLKEMGCTFDRTANHSYTIFLATTSIALPMVIVLLCYSILVYYVRKCRIEVRQIGSMSKKRLHDEIQFAITLFVAFVTFVTSWSPYMSGLLFDFEDRWPKELYVFGTLLGHSNSTINPIIYALASVRFRKGYYVFIHKLFRIKMTKEGYAIDGSRDENILRYTSRSRSPIATSLQNMNACIDGHCKNNQLVPNSYAKV
ncbi:hypothetical protein ACF0H5_023518 [Mactra antiquata]